MQVRCRIFSTGFNAVNTPIDTSVVFNNFEPIYDDYLIINTEILMEIRVKLDFAKACQCDYVILETNQVGEFFCYTIEAVNMLDDFTASFTILADALCSLGGAYNIEMSGSVERYNVSRNEDLFGAFTLPEAFSPNQALTFDSNFFNGSNWGYGYQILELCVDVDTSSRANVLTPISQTENNERLLTPLTKPIAQSTVKFEKYTYKNPMSQYFDNSNGSMNEKINLLRQYGLENSIINSYELPADYGIIRGNNIEARRNRIQTNINPQYGNVFNKKVYCGEFNKVVLLSNCSGEKIEALPEDVSENGANYEYIVLADPRANGKPTAYFSYFKGKKDWTANGVNGLNWNNTPIVWTDKSGSNVDRLNLATSQKLQTQLQGWQNAQTLFAGAGGGIISLLSGNPLESIGKTAGALIDVALQNEILREKQMAEREIFERNQYYTKPEVSFPRSESIRDFEGNGFFLIRYKLSDTDLLQYDTYLSRFGYNVGNVVYDKDKCLMTRPKFQYIKFREVYIMKKFNKLLRDQAERQLLTGIRLWKVPPTKEALTNIGNQ